MKKMNLKINFDFLSERSGDHKRRVPDISKIKKEIGSFNFKSLEDGIQKLI